MEQLTVQIHLTIHPTSHPQSHHSPTSDSSHPIYFPTHNQNNHNYLPPHWLQRFSSLPTSLLPFNSSINHCLHASNFLLSTSNGQLIILRSTKYHQHQHQHHHPQETSKHQVEFKTNLFRHANPSNSSISTSRPNKSIYSPHQTQPPSRPADDSPSTQPPASVPRSAIYSISSATSSSSSIRSLGHHSLYNIKASPTVSISIPNNLNPANLDDQFSITHFSHPQSPQTPHHHHHHHHAHDLQSSQNSKNLSTSHSNDSPSSKSGVPLSSSHPQSPTSSTYSHRCRPPGRNSISHPFESLWQGSTHQVFKSPTFPTTIDPSNPELSSSLSGQQPLLPSPVLPPPSPTSALSFCASTLITPLGYADPIVSIKILNPLDNQQTYRSSTNQSSDLPSSDVAPKINDHSPDSIIFTLTKFGKCSKISPIDGHITQSIDLNKSDGLVAFDDWCILTDPETHMNIKNSDVDNKLPSQQNPLILCVSSIVRPILLDSSDFRILPTIYSGQSIEKPPSFCKTKVWKQSKMSNDHWSINLISLTASNKLWTRELIIIKGDESSWKIEEPSDSILLKYFGDELDLDERVEIVIDQDRIAVWSTRQFWILEKSSITKEQKSLDHRILPVKTDTTKKIRDANDLIVNLSFLGLFGVVVFSKKHVKLFRFVGLESLPTAAWSEWKLASIDEAHFTLEDPFQFEFAINNSTFPSTVDNQAALINSINLLTVEIDPSTGQRRLSELLFTTEPPSHSAPTQESDPDPDATVTLFSANPHVYPCRSDLYLSTPLTQVNKPSPICLTCSIWLPDDYHPAILIGDSAGQISIYSLNITSHNDLTGQSYWKLERLKKEEKIGGPISALYADEQWVIAGGVSGDTAVWSRKIQQSLASKSTTDLSNICPYEIGMVNRIMLGTVPIESVARLPDLEDLRPDAQGIPERVSRFVGLMMDGSVVAFNLSEIGLIEIDGELLPVESTIGIGELWSNGPEIMAFYREKHLGAQRWFSSKGLSATLGRQEAQTMIEFENSQLGLKWVQIELSNCQAQSGGSQLTTSRVFNVSGLPAFNILSVKLRDFVESIGLQEGPALAGRLSMVRLMISQLFPWGLDPALDVNMEQGLGIVQPSIEERLQNLHVINGDLDERSGMTLYRNNGDQRLSSAYEKTYRLLNLVVLLRVFLNEACYERHASEAITGLARLASTNTFSNGCTVWLDLKILIKYWLDPSVEVREAARLLAGIRLGSMVKSEIEDLVSSWESFLAIEEINTVKIDKDWTFGRKISPGNQKDVLKMDEIDPRQKCIKEEMQINAMLLIGLIVSERYKLLPSKVLKDLSIAVFQAVSPSHKSSNNRLKIQTLKAGLEICSKTFEIIQNYIDAIELVRNLFGWATGKDGEISGDLKGMAKYACLHVASVNTPLFMTTLSYDLMISHNPNDRISTMKLVVFMVRKRPLVLHASLPRLLEAVVKSLDPTQKQMRAQTQTGATVILHELVKTYPSIAFHGHSQKLAIGTPEGAIIIYDLKTSTKVNILESFRKPVSACSFSTDGQRLVSVSLDENRIDVWKLFGSTSFPLGFGSFFKFSDLSSSFSLVGPSASSTNHNHQPAGLSNNKPFKSLSFNVGEEAMMSIAGTLEWVRIDWLNNRSCRLRIRQSSITFSC